MKYFVPNQVFFAKNKFEPDTNKTTDSGIATPGPGAAAENICHYLRPESDSIPEPQLA